jgi:hypothetical protein
MCREIQLVNIPYCCPRYNLGFGDRTVYIPQAACLISKRLPTIVGCSDAERKTVEPSVKDLTLVRTCKPEPVVSVGRLGSDGVSNLFDVHLPRVEILAFLARVAIYH